MTLTPEDLKLLRRPFTPEAVKFRIDGNPKNGKVRILTYIDSRLAAERLTEVDPGWSGTPAFVGHSESDPLGLSVGSPVVYHLTVKGSSRSDVGQIGPAAWGDNKGEFEADDKHAKVAVSDALKRAAVLFGVGAYLYTLGNVYVDQKKHTTEGKGKYLNTTGKKFLRDQYAAFIGTKAFKDRFGEPISYGDELASIVSNEKVTEPSSNAKVTKDSVDTSEQADTVPGESALTAASTDRGEAVAGEVSAGTPSPAADSYSSVIAGLFELLDRSPDAGVTWLSARKNKKLALKKTLRQSAEKGADPKKVEKLLKKNGLTELLDSFNGALA